MKQLIQYLLENLVIDISGDLSLEKVREFLRDDDSREGRALLSKLVEDRGVDDFIITLADCLKDHVQEALPEQVVREQIRLYAES